MKGWQVPGPGVRTGFDRKCMISNLKPGSLIGFLSLLRRGISMQMKYATSSGQFRDIEVYESILADVDRAERKHSQLKSMKKTIWALDSKLAKPSFLLKLHGAPEIISIALNGIGGGVTGHWS